MGKDETKTRIIEESEDEESYFENDEDKCPRMGMQGAMIHTRRILK